MIASIPQSRAYQRTYNAYIALFFLLLAAPLVVVAIFSFNDSLFPSLPWGGFTLDWFFAETPKRTGLFHDESILESIWISVIVAVAVAVLSVLVALSNAFLFERKEFPGKQLLYSLMLVPLVIPGVILGISILAFGSNIANGVEDNWGIDLEFLRPGLTMVILGQFAFISTICTLIISARLRKFDIQLEEAALNLGANHWDVLWTITLPWLKPALVGAAIVAFLMSFENFNTTLVLVGSDAPLTINMFDRMREGSTPVLNAVSLLLMVASGGLALLSIFVQREQPGKQ
ncbi:ABC transporter permease subunit [Sansalvadorimonas sp. 2012CJ34-2]|uniref:ABC transporter permease subunit n=1 Tax=Parendozoicomonas callyspongiae TaxID=2942213 RepID=A0ABT0PL06_9GAMM|nr:ABC transporter permease subunit [Sansalvadorimonas sp. 2012CJ34-2]MCL6272059.1 ABC transporter permease subunit [Sansalvadorimonas sp. 2012CJ34-2]